MNDFERHVLLRIREYNLISEGDTVIVGFSGGADSVALIRALSAIRQELALNLRAVHVHHGIRSQEADRDLLFCVELCIREKIPYTIVKKDIPALAKENHLSEEECGRIERYRAFEEEASKYPGSKIAVAHHKDDQAETILFNLMRGSGLHGLTGMEVSRGRIIRPFLDVSKKQILNYLAKLDQPYCTDSTNNDNNYTRNVIRNVIFKAMEKVAPKSTDHIIRLGIQASELERFIDGLTSELYERVLVESAQGKIVLNADLLAKEDIVLSTEVIRKAISTLTDSLKDITYVHIIDIINILENDKSSRVTMPYNLMALKENDRLTIYIRSEADEDVISEAIDTDESVRIPGKTEFGNGDYLSTEVEGRNGADVPTNLYTKWFDYDKINADLRLRTRREGDYIVINAEGKTQKLQDYMINEKIPRSKRDSVPIIASGSHVYWVVGYRISEAVKVMEDTKRVMKLKWNGGDK